MAKNSVNSLFKRHHFPIFLFIFSISELDWIIIKLFFTKSPIWRILKPPPPQCIWIRIDGAVHEFHWILFNQSQPPTELGLLHNFRIFQTDSALYFGKWKYQSKVQSKISKSMKLYQKNTGINRSKSFWNIYKTKVVKCWFR